jgi:putative tricarboxylic transport membrane protein
MRLRADTFTSLLALAISLFILLQGRDLGLGRPSDPGSGFILFWTGIIMTVLSAVLLVQSLVAKAETAAGMGDGFVGLRWGKVLLLVLFKTVEPQSWRVAIIGSALTTFGAWAVFVAWLGTQLPVGILFLPD